MISKELWSKKSEDEEIVNSYQSVIDLKNRLAETCKIAQANVNKQAAWNKVY